MCTIWRSLHTRDVALFTRPSLSYTYCMHYHVWHILYSLDNASDFTHALSTHWHPIYLGLISLWSSCIIGSPPESNEQAGSPFFGLCQHWFVASIDQSVHCSYTRTYIYYKWSAEKWGCAPCGLSWLFSTRCLSPGKSQINGQSRENVGNEKV